ncbi:MAG: tRNA (adenosine(37)-N6)-threonylcarbamoyltransferase complex ATPase subunit type 1 TsaE [Bacteroidales bacterium]|nr:tRNA (adenosine(37)-N6)-threonylcarbamoyltransferase complex ATPase subunit type 1 TsaE [Bacteroidales bacterium]
MVHNVIAAESELPEVARKLLEAYPDERVFGFFGEMGTGKTTLIKEICRQLGVAVDMTSPTFAIVNEYWTSDGQPLYHFDFYRIDEPDDATRIGFQDYLYSGNYCFIEWTEKVESLLRGEYTPVRIERVDDRLRRFSF